MARRSKKKASRRGRGNARTRRPSARRRKWIQGARLKKGALHKAYGISAGTKIPYRWLVEDQHAHGLFGQRVRAALNMRRLKWKRKRGRSR